MISTCATSSFPSRRSRLFRGALAVFVLCAAGLWGQAAQPTDAPMLPLSEVKAGMTGEVWTVFQGSTPEPFSVEVTGIIRNALGPGKSLILCRLTDPRVQLMGAVAGMSGSPLYIDGKFAGALSYQVQRFETVRYAGFTPVEDLLEVQRIALNAPPASGGPSSGRESPGVPVTRSGSASGASVADDPLIARFGAGSLQPLTPVFTLGGIAPNVAALFSERFQALGLQVSNLGGSDAASPASAATTAMLGPGDAVAAALAVGDITLAGTGTVSQVQGSRVLAFGHPMLGLGTVAVPMATAEIVTILPSNLSSFKISNTGTVIGTVRQDRLSAIYGELGPGPELVPVTVKTPTRTLQFSTVRHPRLTPTIATLGLSQAVLGSNDAGMAEGFRVASRVTLDDGRELTNEALFAGPQGFNSGLESFIRRLTTWVQNPVEEVFPASIVFEVEPLSENPAGSLDIVQVSRRTVSAGESVDVSLTLRDFQGTSIRRSVTIPIPPAWIGRALDIVVASGAELDRISGLPEGYTVSQIRTIDAYLDALERERRSDGLYVAVVEKNSSFIDQTTPTYELPGSFERIARGSDETRFQRREVLTPIWEQHIFAGKLISAGVRRPLVVTE